MQARNRAPVPLHVLAKVKAALERMPPAPAAALRAGAAGDHHGRAGDAR
jgi:hypothetical protein